MITRSRFLLDAVVLTTCALAPLGACGDDGGGDGDDGGSGGNPARLYLALLGSETSVQLIAREPPPY